MRNVMIGWQEPVRVPGLGTIPPYEAMIPMRMVVQAESSAWIDVAKAVEEQTDNTWARRFVVIGSAPLTR